MMPHEKLKQAIEIINSLDGFDHEKLPTVTGVFGSSADFDAALDFFSQEFSDQDLEISSDSSTLEVSFYVPKSIYYSLARYLHYAVHRTKVILQPIGFIEGGDVFNPSTGRQNRVAKFNYLEDIIDLFGQIKSFIADYHVERGSDTILFFTGKTKLEVTDQYGVDDLIQLAKLEDFKRDFLIQNDPHTKQRKDIFKKSIIGFFDGKEKISFSEFIQGFDKLCEAAHNNLVLYLDDFAFDKIKQTIEKDKLEHITRISKVFSDIQNQLFGAPASVVIVASQVQAGDSAKNYAILAGSFLYAVFMTIAIYNQCQTLKAIQAEFKAQLTLLNGRQAAVKELFIGTYTDLQTRSEKQECLLYLSGGLVMAGFLATVVVFCLLK